jgi:hypothetical protein
MDRAKSFLYESFWGIAVIAIILLAPSSGLITLTVPDEPYGSAIGLPDTTHIGKRASEDSEHFAFDATFSTFNIHPRLYVLDAVAYAQQNDPQNTFITLAQIRAPPDTVSV